MMAMAARTTIVEADKIVEVGEIDPEHVVTPGAFVDRIVEIPEDGYGTPEKGAKLIELLSQIGSVRDLLFGKTDQK
jgi:3-oxoadipate CoA-transferase alpha subunit